VRIITNGVALQQSRWANLLPAVQELNISLDADNAVVFKKLKHYAAFLNILHGLDMIIRKRESAQAKLQISISYIINELNLSGLDRLVLRLKEMGVNSMAFKLNLFEKNEPYFKKAEQLLAELKDKYSDSSFQIGYPDLFEDFSTLKFNGNCEARKYWLEVGPDGRVYPCSHFASAGYPTYGNLLEENLEQIMQRIYSQLDGRDDPMECSDLGLCNPASRKLNIILNK